MASNRSEPSYLALARNGQLRERVARAVRWLGSCRCCPRSCGAARARDETGVCGVGRRARVASAFPHHGEEDCLRGRSGSGTIFLSGCNLRCVFCQNHDISHGGEGRPVTAARLAALMVALQEAGCHNLNWVSPSHVVPQLLEGLVLAAERGLRLPIVYNTGGYDSLEALRLLDGVVDIYMPDFKFWDPAVAGRLAQAPDYPEVARAALREMHRQVGDLVLDEQGLARRGLLVRHLVLPNGLAGTRPIAEWIASALSPNTYVNVMAQYHPDGPLLQTPDRSAWADLGRPMTDAEFQQALLETREAGLHRLDRRRAFA